MISHLNLIGNVSSKSSRLKGRNWCYIDDAAHSRDATLKMGGFNFHWDKHCPLKLSYMAFKFCCISIVSVETQSSHLDSAMNKWSSITTHLATKAKTQQSSYISTVFIRLVVYSLELIFHWKIPRSSDIFIMSPQTGNKTFLQYWQQRKWSCKQRAMVRIKCWLSCCRVPHTKSNSAVLL